MQKNTPTPERYWLKEHQITAFWHTFGISNGLTVPKEHIKLHTYAKGTPKQVYVVSREFMREQLAHYVQKLKEYAEHWDGEEVYEGYPKNKQEFLEGEAFHASRANVLAMIELLQEYRIVD